MNTPTRGRRTADKEKKKSLANLNNPAQLRAVITGAVLALAYFGFYGPLSAQLDNSHAELDAQLQRFAVVCDIERLRDQYKLFKDRLTTNADTNQWVQYVLDGVRKFPVKLLALDPDKVRDVGPYKAVVVRVDLEGSLADINRFMAWLETNERLIRIDTVNIQPVRNKKDVLIVTLTIVGIMG